MFLYHDTGTARGLTGTSKACAALLPSRSGPRGSPTCVTKPWHQVPSVMAPQVPVPRVLKFLHRGFRLVPGLCLHIPCALFRYLLGFRKLPSELGGWVAIRATHSKQRPTRAAKVGQPGPNEPERGCKGGCFHAAVDQNIGLGYPGE